VTGVREGLRPLDDYEPGDGTDPPYGSYYVVLPEGPWGAGKSTVDIPGHAPRPRPSGLLGVVSALVAGTIPALLVDLPAALVAGVAAGVFGGLTGTALGAELHDRGRRRAEG
jgi:hypothetical protein